MPDSKQSTFSAVENDLWEALYAIRCIAEHTGGKNASARKMRGEIATIRETADQVLSKYPQLSP